MIGIQNEGALHASLKEHYRRNGDVIEGVVDGFFIDLVQEQRLVEIQTGNFGALRQKLVRLLQNHKVHVVHPIVHKRYITQVEPESGEQLSCRKSPKKGTIYDLFTELMRIPELLVSPGLSVEAVFVVEREIRCRDGRGSWRRGGASILDRQLLEILGQHIFRSRADYVALLPPDLPVPFSNRDLANLAKIPINTARKMTYTLKKAGFIKEVGKKGNELLHCH